MVRREVSNRLLLPQICQLIKNGEQVRLRVKGRSMEPCLYGGRDEVILSPCQPLALLEGAVVLAFLSTPQRYVLHRIIHRSENCLTLMGDGNVKGVEYCDVTDVKAVAYFAFRKGRKISLSAGYWQRYAWVWHLLLPVRGYLLGFLRIRNRFVR